MSDEQRVISLRQECGLVVPWNNPAKDIERKLKVCADLFLIGEIDGNLVATVMGGYDGHRGWINYLAIHPDYRRRGYGRQIMEAVEQRIDQKGCPKINLQVRAGNDEAVTFYQRLGYSDDNVIGLGKRLIDDTL